MSDEKNKKGAGRPATYPYASMAVGDTKRIDVQKHPGAANAAYQAAYRTGAKFSVKKRGVGEVVVTRTA
jgi:hypothetical protein